MTSSTPPPTLPQHIETLTRRYSTTLAVSTSNASNTTPGISPPVQLRQIHVFQILVGQMFDPIRRVLVTNQVITIDREAGIILDVSPRHLAERIVDDIRLIAFGDEKNSVEVDFEVTTLDMGGITVLPGLVDVHVHREWLSRIVHVFDTSFDVVFLHPYSETPWEDQVNKESLTERTVRATVHARKTLLAGFTTVRDLGTEGAFDADIGLRKCLSEKSPIIPGPRYYCVTRAIIASGSYGPRSLLYPAQQGVDGVNGAEPVDGIDNCIKEVRKQVGAGADWIKIYADYSCRARMADVSSSTATESIATFNKDELAAMINTAHARGVKVCAHANTAGAINTLLDLGVDSIEHGVGLYDHPSGDNTLLRKFTKANGATTWVPTLAALYTLYATNGGSEFARKRWEAGQATFTATLRAGMENIACGGDTGVFTHGANALELVLMRSLGAGWAQVLSWATYGGWKCVRGMDWEGPGGERRMQALEIGLAGLLGKCHNPAYNKGELERGVPFGAIRAGWAADLVGVVGTLDGSIEDFEKALTTGVSFVMKGGKIYKQGSQEVV
ncbi:hypothetical protein BDN70DRAFT_879394 [Pholiota conissans]|uniref:Amidohydrolase-related domain-containing protein n=1 Tax=Pholiota conissans TaxID=109636 RepID=A0A9P6D0Q8_9AGAR|nr:hypothetical protein BDN70DRAFT_879394 [Pholiota conissans]